MAINYKEPQGNWLEEYVDPDPDTNPDTDDNVDTGENTSNNNGSSNSGGGSMGIWRP